MLLDQAIATRDPLRFEDACKAMFAWAVEFAISHGLRNDGDGAEQAVQKAWAPVVMGFIAAFSVNFQGAGPVETPFAARQHDRQANRRPSRTSAPGFCEEGPTRSGGDYQVFGQSTPPIPGFH